MVMSIVPIVVTITRITMVMVSSISILTYRIHLITIYYLPSSVDKSQNLTTVDWELSLASAFLHDPCMEHTNLLSPVMKFRWLFGTVDRPFLPSCFSRKRFVCKGNISSWLRPLSIEPRLLEDGERVTWCKTETPSFFFSLLGLRLLLWDTRLTLSPWRETAGWTVLVGYVGHPFNWDLGCFQVVKWGRAIFPLLLMRSISAPDGGTGWSKSPDWTLNPSIVECCPIVLVGAQWGVTEPAELVAWNCICSQVFGLPTFKARDSSHKHPQTGCNAILAILQRSTVQPKQSQISACQNVDIPRNQFNLPNILDTCPSFHLWPSFISP